MRKLVLDHTAAEAVEFLDDLLEVLVIVLDLYLRGATHLGINSGYAQAALRIFAGLFAFLKHDGIDHHANKIVQIIICIGKVTSINDDNAEIHSHLRSSKTAAVCNLEGLLHVLDELKEGFLVVKIGVFVFSTEDVGSVEIDW